MITQYVCLFQDSPQHEKILQEVVMDILRVLSSPDLEVRRKTLNLAMELVTSRNIEEMVLVLKKVIIYTLSWLLSIARYLLLFQTIFSGSEAV